MKPTLARILKVLLPLLGLLWVISCSNPTGGGGGTPGPTYTIDIWVEPDSIPEDGLGIVYCFLKSNGVPLDDETIYFRSASEAATITGSSYSWSASHTGTEPEVHYFPNYFAGDVDTIFAHLEDFAGDTLVFNWTTVTVLHE